MVLVDKKILSGGLAMISVGIILTIVFAEQPTGQTGMTEEEIIPRLIIIMPPWAMDRRSSNFNSYK